VTTRSPRVGELDGRDYHFTKAASFERRIRDGGFAEWARYGPHYYGTPRAALDQAQEAGEDIVLTIDVQGGAQIRARYPEAVLVFMLPPDLDTLAQRLRDRGSETDEAIGRRLEALPDEIRAAAMYDYTVNNCGTVEQAAAAMNSIVEAEHMRMSSLRADRCARFQLTESTQ
jgi:guanylate kinase